MAEAASGATERIPAGKVERVRWAVGRRYGAETPYITPLESPGLVGEAFFGRWARENGATITPSPPDGGILRSLDDLASADFDPTRVSPVVRPVYESGKTLRYRAGSVAWGSLGARAFHWTYQRLVARSMKQLSAPVDAGLLPTIITSHIDVVAPRAGGHVPPFRAWTRRYQRNDEVFYTAAVFPFGADGPRGPQRYVCCVLPLSHANIAVVFHPQNLDGGGCRLSTYADGSYCAGVYTVLPGARRYAVFPAPMKEHIDLRPRIGHSGPYVEGRHQTWAFGSRSYTLSYELRPERLPPGG